MAILIIGLVIFIGSHLSRVLAPNWRENMIVSIGKNAWKGIYSVVSLASLVLIVWGFGEARQSAPILFDPPEFMTIIALLLMAPAFILMMAGNLRPGRIAIAVKHPMVTSIKVWAFAHLLANGDLASLILFGTFLAYSIFMRIAYKRRGETGAKSATPSADVIAIVSGLAIWALFVFWLHDWLIGVPVIA